MGFNKKAHLRANIEAIKLAFVLDKEQRTATTVEREVLSAYSGFGALKCILKSDRELRRPRLMEQIGCGVVSDGSGTPYSH